MRASSCVGCIRFSRSNLGRPEKPHQSSRHDTQTLLQCLVQLTTKYPWRRVRYRDITYTNQDARIREGYLLLPNGKSGTLRVHLPDTVTIPGRLREVRLGLFCVQIVCEVPDL